MLKFLNICLCALICGTATEPVDKRERKSGNYIFYREAILPEEIRFIDDDSVPDEVDE